MNPVLGYGLTFVAGVGAGIWFALWYIRRHSASIAQGMWNALSQLSLHDACIAFTKQRKTLACAMVIAEREGMVATVTTAPSLTDQQRQEFERAAAASLLEYVKHMERQRSQH